MRSPVSSCGTLAMEIRLPERDRISLILEPPLPLLHQRSSITEKGHSHDATDHITWDADVLGPHIGIIDIRTFASPPEPSLAAAAAHSASRAITRRSSITSKCSSRRCPKSTSSHARPPNPTGRPSDSLRTLSSCQHACITSCTGVILDSTDSSVPILH